MAEQTPHEHAHHKQTQAVINRLARAEGHLHAVRRMVEEGAPCPDVLVQIAAVRSALDRVARIVLSDHMESCVRRTGDDAADDAAWADLKQALDRYIR